jgi:hypothetical protein
LKEITESQSQLQLEKEKEHNFQNQIAEIKKQNQKLEHVNKEQMEKIYQKENIVKEIQAQIQLTKQKLLDEKTTFG